MATSDPRNTACVLLSAQTEQLYGRPAVTAADRLACLHRVALALPSTLSVADVGRVFVYEGRAGLGVDAGALYLVDPTRHQLCPAYATGEGLASPLALDGSHPAARAASTGVLAWPGGGALDEVEGEIGPDQPVLAAAPVLAEGRTLAGALVFGAYSPWCPDEDDRAMLLSLARLCGHALDHLAHRDGELNAREEVLRERVARARAESALSRAEAILGSARYAVVECDLDDRITYWSPGAERLYGYAASEALSGAVGMLAPADHLQEMEDLQQRVRSGEPTEGLRTVHEANDGRSIAVCLDAVPLRSSEGTVRGWLAVVDDITEQRRVEDQRERLLQRLRSERAHLFAVVDELPAGVIVAEAPSGRIVLANREAARILCQEPLSAHNVDGYARFHAVRPDGSPLETQQFPLARALASGEAVRERELDIRRGDGTTGSILANAAAVRGPNGEVVAAVMAFVDISAHRQAERALRASEQRFRAAIEHFPDAFVILDGKRRIQFANSMWCRLFGVREQEVSARRDEEVFPAEVTRGYLPALRHAIGSGEPQTLEWMAPGTLGGRTFTLSYIPLCDDKGRPRQVLGIAHDITERRRFETALRASEGRFRALAEATPQMVWTTGSDGACDYANRRWLDYTGFSLQETAERGLAAAAHPDDERRVAEAWSTAVRDRTHFECEFRLRQAATGRYRWFLARGVPVLDARGRVVKWFGTTTDVDDLRDALAKIEVLNLRLRTGMRETHHRIKNNLQVIAALVDMQVMTGAETVPVAELQRLGRHVRSLATVHDILTHEAAVHASADRLHVPTALSKLGTVLQGMTAGRPLELDADDISLPVRHGTALVVLMNEVVCNAAKHGQGAIRLSLKRHNGRARLVVSDEGPGFPPGFDPRADANTGLELVEMVGRHDLQGTVEYANTPDGGASVIIDFPVDDPAAP